VQVGGVAALAMKYEQTEAIDTAATLERTRSKDMEGDGKAKEEGE